MHIMKLECLAKIPFGLYAELERSNSLLTEINTADGDQCLDSLKVRVSFRDHSVTLATVADFIRRGRGIYWFLFVDFSEEGFHKRPQQTEPAGGGGTRRSRQLALI